MRKREVLHYSNRLGIHSQIMLVRLNMVAVWSNDGKFEMLREVGDLAGNEASNDEDENCGDDSS